MSVRVNLLPGDVAARDRAARRRAGIIAAMGLLVVALAAIWWMQLLAVQDAETRLAEVQAENARVQAEVAALAPFAELAARADEAAGVVAAAMAREASLAAVLQDLSAVLPPDTELESLSLAIAPTGESPTPGGVRLSEARLTAAGRTTAGLAPGMERLLIDVGRLATFDNVFMSSSSLDDDGVTSFTLEVELGSEILTGRYAALLREVAQ